MSEEPRRWLLPLAATIFAMMTMQMSSLGFSPLIPDIQADFAMTHSQVGLFTGMYGLVAIVMSIPGGLLAKRFGERNVLTTGLVITALGLGILSLAPDFLTGLAGRAVWIVGYRVSFVCVMTAVAFSAPPALKGLAMGILGSMSSLATVIGAPFGIAVAHRLGWRIGIGAFAVMALFGAAVFFALYRRLSDKPAPLGTHGRQPVHGPVPLDTSALAEADSPFRNPMVWSLILLGTVNMGGFSATFFIPSALQTTFSLPPEKASQIISTSYMFAIVANLIFGRLCDRFNRWHMMLLLPLIMLPACFTMMIPNLLFFWVSAALLIGLGLCATNQLYTLASELAGGNNVASVMGIASLGGGVFGYIGPQALGYLRERTGDFTAGWWFVAGGLLISFFELLALKHYINRRALAQEERGHDL